MSSDDSVEPSARRVFYLEKVAPQGRPFLVLNSSYVIITPSEPQNLFE